MHYPSVMSAVGQHCNEKERTFVYSVISAGSHGGTLFTGLVGSIILENYGWEAVFHFIGMASSKFYVKIQYGHNCTSFSC